MFFKLLNLFKGFFFFTGSYSVNVFPPPLTSSEEYDNILKMNNGDIDARNRLIEHNLRLVAHLVKKYEGKDISSDDLISIGTIGLIKGIDSYNLNKNIKLTTYIAKCAENEILMYFRSNKHRYADVSLNDTLGIDKDGNEIYLLDVIPDNTENFDLTVQKNIDVSSMLKFMDVLSLREKNIIIKRYGLYGSDVYTQKDIARIMGISRSYVSRLEKRALIKLYKEFYRYNKKDL